MTSQMGQNINNLGKGIKEFLSYKTQTKRI